MKKFFLIALSLFLSILLEDITASADTFYNEDNECLFIYDVENNGIAITSGCANEIIIPESINNSPVIRLAKRMMFINSYYTNVVLPETLIFIDDEAILGCENIKEIIIPKNVKKIGLHALGYTYDILPMVNNQGYIEVYEKMNDFRIKGYAGTVAETYANENGFTFIALEESEVTTTVTTSISTTTETTVSTTVTTPIETTVSTTTSEPIKILGDANGDGKLNVRDCAYIARMFANGKGGKLPQTADFNGDGIVNVRDASAIARYLALK